MVALERVMAKKTKAQLLEQARNPKAKKKKTANGKRKPKKGSGVRKKKGGRKATPKAIDKIVRGK